MTLADLPLEILNIVCANLTYYEQFVGEHGDNEDHEDEEIEECNSDSPAEVLEIECEKGSLLNLCLVSKHMRQIAEIHLYSFFDGKRHNVGFFFRSLTEQPRYAAYIRGLRIEPLGDDSSWRSIDKDLGLEWTSSALCSILHRAAVVSKSFPSHLTYFVRLTDNASQQEIIAQWLILNLPKLEMLKISIPREWSFQFLGYIAKFDSSLLQHLNTLHVLGPPTWQIFYGSPSLVCLDPVACLLSLPRLEDFCLDYCVELEEDENIVTNAQRIAHWRCGVTKCQIGKLLSTCTKLRCYELEYGGGIALDLSYLSPSVETLRSLELEVHDFTPNLLTKYHNLKNIRITTDSIELRLPGSLPSKVPLRPPPPPPDTLLSNMLPLGIEQICLGPTYRDAAKLWQSQLETLLNNKFRKFRNMKLIEIAWQPSEQLQKACSQAAIELRAF